MSEEAKEAPPAGEEAAPAVAAAGNGDAPAAGAGADAGGGAAPAAAAPNAAPPEAAAAAAPDAAAGGPAPPVGNVPSLATELSGYFTTLQTALRRQLGTASATGGGRSSVAQVLHEGVASITAAGHGTVLFERASSPDAASGGGGGRAPMTPRQAALYLYAVAQNIVALEAAVLGSRPNGAYAAAGGGGGLAAGLDGIGLGNAQGGLGARQVQEIVAAAGIAATFCDSRSLIAQSGILPALAHLIESTGTVSEPPSAYLKSAKNGKKGGAISLGGGGGSSLHAMTPFHPDFLHCALLAGQYRYASSFLANRPTSHMTLAFPYLKLDPATYLRAHYYAGLVHIGCDNWNAALDAFHLCLTMPCGTNVSAVAIAARKKSLLVQCLLLESEELDGSGANGGGGNSGLLVGQQLARSGGGAGGGKSKSALENRVLELPGAVSAAVSKYMTVANDRVVRRGSEMESNPAAAGQSASERTAAGSETSEPRPAASRRRVRNAHSASSSDAAAGERGAQGAGRPKKDSHLGSYHDLVSTYISGNASHYATLLAEMNELLHRDGNWGLAKRLEGRLAYRAVRQVASVYSVAGADKLEGKLAEVSSNLAGSAGGGEMGKRGVEDLLMGMAAGDARDPLLADPFVAKIDHSTGTVSFLECDDDDECSDDDSRDMQTEADLSHRLQSCITLAERVRDLDVALTTSPGYRQHIAREMMMKGSQAAAGAMKGQGGAGASVADIGHGGPMDIGVDW